jgi:hypothetical protein
VTVLVRSVPQSVSGASGMIVPSCVRGPRAAPVRLGREQVRLAHQSQYADLARADAAVPQLRPHFTVTRSTSPGAKGPAFLSYAVLIAREIDRSSAVSAKEPLIYSHALALCL